jgi:hypothetical protein
VARQPKSEIKLKLNLSSDEYLLPLLKKGKFDYHPKKKEEENSPRVVES